MTGVSLHDHYHQPDLAGRILAAVRAAGVAPASLTHADLEALDEFHLGGAAATARLGELAASAPEHLVLDLGCGIGGPARRLAAAHGCRVVGLDLVPGYVAAAAALTGLVGPADRVAFLAGDMRRLPCADACCDRVWSQHTFMNIPDKAALAAELRRVLRPTGRLVLYEVCTGDGSMPILPVPWASAPEHSHLVTPDELRRTLAAAGLPPLVWEDVTGEVLAWFDGLAAAPVTGRGPRIPGLTLRLVMGPDAGLKSRNLAANLRAGRVVVVRAACGA